MKKRILILTLVVCAFLMLGSVSVFAADDASSDVTASVVAPSAGKVFFDVAPREWYYNYISFVSKHNIFQGYPEGNFAPNRNMTRAEVVRVLYTLEGEPVVQAGNRFSDVPANEWYAEEVEWAASIGVVAGYPDGTFGPQKHVSRQDFVTMLCRYAAYKGYDVDGRAELNFPDASAVNDYAKDSFAWAIDAGIINGIEESTGNYLRPASGTTRAQVAKMLAVFAVEFKELGGTDDVVAVAEEHTITVGCSRLLQYAVFPSDTSFAELTWTSSDTNIVTVSRGIVTGVSAGNATVTATSFDGNSAVFKITVTDTPADPYKDVVDYIELHANGGYWNENPMITFSGTEDGVEYTYSICEDYATGSVYFLTEIYDAESEIEMKSGFYTAYGSDYVLGTVELTDYFEAVSWSGENDFHASMITPDTELPIEYFYCTDSFGYVSEMQDYLGETLTMELHAWLIDLDAIFADWGLKTTIKDFGFVNY